MGLILDGEADFITEKYTVDVKPGDIIFVPISSTYKTVWYGVPKIRYISMHFIFDTPIGLFTEKKVKLQKLSLDNFAEIRSDYEYILENFQSGDEACKLNALGRFSEFLHRSDPCSGQQI